MKNFLILTAVIEAATGLALLIVPAAVVKLLLGSEISGVSIPLARVTGAALLALGFGCWMARSETPGKTTRGIVASMLLYNIAVVAVLVPAGLDQRSTPIGLWLAVILHGVMTSWCVASLRSVNSSTTSASHA
jgi:hypothetical protein